MPDRLGFWKRS